MSFELIANLFRISQTEQKLKKDNVKTEDEANNTHFIVGRKIRNTTKDLGGTMTKDMETPLINNKNSLSYVWIGS